MLRIRGLANEISRSRIPYEADIEILSAGTRVLCEDRSLSVSALARSGVSKYLTARRSYVPAVQNDHYLLPDRGISHTSIINQRQTQLWRPRLKQVYPLHVSALEMK